MGPDSRSHRTLCPNALQHRRGGLHPTQTVVKTSGEDNEDNRDEPGAAEVANGATDATMVKPSDRIEIDKTDNANRNETLVMVSADHETVETPDDARGATIAIATEMDPLDATQRTQHP